MQDAAPREFPPSQETREVESKFQANSLEACRSGLAPCSAPLRNSPDILFLVEVEGMISSGRSRLEIAEHGK